MHEAQQEGYVGYAGIEPEFIVMKYNDDGQPVKAFDDDPANGLRPRRQAFGYDVEYSIDSMPYLKDLLYPRSVNLLPSPDLGRGRVMGWFLAFGPCGPRFER